MLNRQTVLALVGVWLGCAPASAQFFDERRLPCDAACRAWIRADHASRQRPARFVEIEEDDDVDIVIERRIVVDRPGARPSPKVQRRSAERRSGARPAPLPTVRRAAAPKRPIAVAKKPERRAPVVAASRPGPATPARAAGAARILPAVPDVAPSEQAAAVAPTAPVRERRERAAALAPPESAIGPREEAAAVSPPRPANDTREQAAAVSLPEPATEIRAPAAAVAPPAAAPLETPADRAAPPEQETASAPAPHESAAAPDAGESAPAPPLEMVESLPEPAPEEPAAAPETRTRVAALPRTRETGSKAGATGSSAEIRQLLGLVGSTPSEALTIGEFVDPAVPLRPLPDAIKALRPYYAGLLYAIIGDTAVFVYPATRRVLVTF